jgi:uncharacterized membrane protein
MALLVYLIAASLAGIVIASRSSHSAALRLLLYMAVGWPFFVWLETHEASPWIVPGAATLAAIYTMHLMAQIEESRRTQAPFSRADIVLFHLNGLGLFAAAYLLVDRVAPGRGHALALSLAALNALLARSLAKSPTRAAMHALALAFTMVALAIGLAFDGVWVAIGWAAEGAAVACLGLSSARRWMRLGGVALLMVGVTVLLTGEFLQTLSGFVPVFNKRALTTAIVVGLLYAVAWFEARSREPRPPPFELGILMGVASFVTVAWLTAEVSSYWREHGGTAGSRFAADLSLSIVWALYAIALVVAGIRRRYAPVRYFAIVLFSLTLLKLFLSDLSQLAGIYRIAGFVAVGLILLAASLLYQKFRARLASG